MFKSKPAPTVVAKPLIQAGGLANLATSAADAKKSGTPMIGGSAGMMLKGMGIDPAQVDAVAHDFIENLSALVTTLKSVEAQNKLILARLDVIERVSGINAEVVRIMQEEASGNS